jgi:gluconolactonase
VSRSAGALDALLAEAVVEELAGGFWFTEGPVWVPARGQDPGHLLFNDIPGQVRRRWDLDGRVTEIACPTNNANGLALDGQGRLLVCEHASSRVVRLEPDGRTTVLAQQWQGIELNSPNDVVVDALGDIWFTDPRYGRRAVHGIERPNALPFCGLYRVSDADRSPVLHLVEDQLLTPNGLCFSPDGERLYVNDTEAMCVYRYRLTSERGLADRELFLDQGMPFDVEAGFPDGMKCDATGNIWVSGPGGIWVVAPNSTVLGVLEVPRIVGNFCFGGPDGTWLFICATDRLFRVRTRTAGASW